MNQLFIDELDRLDKRVAAHKEREGVDKQSDRLIHHLSLALEQMSYEYDEARRQLRMHLDKADGAYWAWAGDEYDHPESLVIPIMIDPRKMLEIQKRTKEYEHALSAIAKQKTPYELEAEHAADSEDSMVDDYEFAYDCCVRQARAVLPSNAMLSGDKPESQK